MSERRRNTATSNFGVSKRENHDATGFYQRFSKPEISDDQTVLQPAPVTEPFMCGDARAMHTVADGSVALVVTSPPYFAGKQYEEELERDGVPSSYGEYLQMLHDVFAECVRTLEPGGRIAVNVANLGRKPYRSLSSDVISILQDDLGLLLRGEVIWQKAEGATGSCAWGSFRSPANPVLRDITERVIIASKGRFDRALNPTKRRARGLPSEHSILTEDFMSLTLDVWSIPPESAKRVGHPAPFPVELPLQLINLLTYEQDLVLDPFMGSGSALAAAALSGRRYVGYDLDPAYVAIARERVGEALRAGADTATEASIDTNGKAAKRVAEELLIECGFTTITANRRVPRTGVVTSFAAADASGRTWYFDVAGAHTSARGGMTRADTAWRMLGRANALRDVIAGGTPYVLLTTELPRRGGEADLALRAAGPAAFFDAIDMLAPSARERLRGYASASPRSSTPPQTAGFWTERDLGPR